MVSLKSLRLVVDGWTSEKCIPWYVKSDTTLCNMTCSLKHKPYGWTSEKCIPQYIKSDTTLQNRLSKHKPHSKATSEKENQGNFLLLVNDSWFLC